MIGSSLRVMWICLCAALATCFVFLPMVLTSMIGKTGNAAFTISRYWAVFMLAMTGVRIHISGLDHVDRKRRFLIVANHQSNFDVLALVTTLGIQFRWIIKQEIRNVPLFGTALYASRNIFIDRSRSQEAISQMKDAVGRLPDTISIMCFAEGTRSPDGNLLPFKRGGFLLAMENHLPILPVAIIGSRNVLPKGKLAFRSGIIEVRVMQPIETSVLALDDCDHLIEQTRRTIEQSLIDNQSEEPELFDTI